MTILMHPKFPLTLREKDSGRVFQCASVDDIQYHCEKIDIENREYEAWDSEGHPVKMSVQKPIWVKIEMAEECGTSRASSPQAPS
jgi:hypothetical protein